MSDPRDKLKEKKKKQKEKSGGKDSEKKKKLPECQSPAAGRTCSSLRNTPVFTSWKRDFLQLQITVVGIL